MLSALQKQALAVMARQAWDALSLEERAAAMRAASEAANDPLGVSEAQAFKWWRQQHQIELTGKASMRDMIGDDYNVMKSRWLFLKGDHTGSLRAEAAFTEEGERRLRYRIQQAAEAHGLPHPAYAERLAQDKFGQRFTFLNEAQLTQIIATINNRGRHSVRRAESAKPKIDKNVKLAPRSFTPIPHHIGVTDGNPF